MGAFTQNDIMFALDKMGIAYENILYKLVDRQRDPYFEKCVKGILSKDDFDAVFSVNFFPVLARICNELSIKYPNMKAVHDYFMEQIELTKFKIHEDFSFKPIVLLGNAGCGKTSYVVEFAKIIQGKPAIRIDLGNDVPSFSCVGSDPTYVDAKHGLILESMFADDDGHPVKNPIVHFDELDKIDSSSKYTIETIFYSILEKSTAKNFKDNFFCVEVDASGINYIFTANNPKTNSKQIKNF